MTETELLNLISLGEDSILELKDLIFKNNKITGPHRDSIADEMSAMANSYGGTIILGVNDKTHEITGIETSNINTAENWIKDIANDLISPPLDCKITKHCLILNTDNNKNILRIDVTNSSTKCNK